MMSGVVCAWRGAVFVALLVFGASSAFAQNVPVPPVQSPILIVDLERLRAESTVMRALVAVLDEERLDLVAENRALEEDLRQEELTLTQQRPDLPVEQFQELARAFDEKVQLIRETQDSKRQEMLSKTQEVQQLFLSVIEPILGGIMGEMGGVVMMERSSVVLGAEGVDVTDLALQRIDASIESLSLE